MNLDLSFYSWEVISRYIIQGFWFSIQLTVIATLGGLFLGTVLAMMRLSSKSWLRLPADAYVNVMRSIPLVMVILLTLPVPLSEAETFMIPLASISKVTSI